SNYEAELGRAGGAVTNVTLRSGSNDLHGSVYEFNRVSKLAARNVFAAGKAHTVYNQYGFTLGGPIIRNKTFVFGDYQGIRDRRTVRVKDTDSFDVQVDHHVSNNDSFFVRYSFQRPKVFDPGLYGIYGGPKGDGFAGTGINRTQAGGFNYTHIFDPAFITEFRLGFSRYNNVADNQDTGSKIDNELGIPGVNLDRFTSGMPYFNLDGFTNPVIGFSPSLPWIRAETNVDLVSNWTRILHNHTVKWGADIRDNKDDLLQTQTYSPRGRFYFRPGTTALNDGGASGFANAFASFLLDLPNEYGRDLPGTFPIVRPKPLFTYVNHTRTVA